ncbi:hypothetical protein NKI66_19820 [Mesorhizobium sp. M0518]|uniref:hypothetical protein n=2 Tax=unclassified Mesorhizobium TaxID=325217 RepID=UPI003338A569
MPICIAKVRPGSQRAAYETVTAILAGCKADAAFGKCGTSCWPARWWPAAIATPCCRRHVRAQGGRSATIISCASWAYGGNRTMPFDRLRDEEIADSMLTEIGGKNIEKPPQLEAWLPRWVKFPAESYTSREASYSPICAQGSSRCSCANSRSRPERRFLEYCR